MFGFYLVRFSDVVLEATVTDDASIVEYWLANNSVASSSSETNIVGLNCKYQTIELCMGTKCLVLQLSRHSSVPASLKRFLSDPKNVFVGIEVEEVVTRLKKEYGVWCNDTVFDVRSLACRRYPFRFGSTSGSRVGLKTLACELLNVMAVGRPKEQVERLSVDVHVLYSIGFKLLMGII